MRFEMAARTVGRSVASQDRVALIPVGDGVVAVVADGAGGTAGGTEAAQLVIDRLAQAVEQGRELNERGLRQLLLEFAIELEGRGQTTAVVVVVGRDQLVGASVGDSGAWLVERGAWRDLTGGQSRKPLLGAGFAEPKSFTCELRDAELLLATDGVLNYAPGETLRALLLDQDVPAADCCDALIDAARLPNGKLQDDAGVVLVRLRPQAKLVNELRAWVPGEQEPRPLWSELERWLLRVLPRSPPFVSGTDGLQVELDEVNADGALVISGVIWSMAPNQSHPIKAWLQLGRDRIEAYQVKVGEGEALRSSS
jgi:PPM family protein phosphatase